MSKYTHDFKDKVVVVTGAAGIICFELAKAFAECGARVALLDLNEEMAKEKANEINKLGGIAKGYKCNVLEVESIKQAHDAIVKDFGTCDILLNGAGGNNPKATTDNEYHELTGMENLKTFFNIDAESMNFVFNLNMLGTLLPTQVFSKEMIGKKGCSIINISSMNAYTPLTKIPAYSGAKAAVSNFTQWLATYFSHVGIRCNAIAPGFLSTAQNAKLLFDENGNPTARTAKILNGTPMGRFGKPEEMVGAVLFLADEKAASFVTGIVIPIDGGFSAYSGV